MGYQTAYSLEMVPLDDDLLNQIAEEEKDFDYAINEPCKWYGHEEDMLRISKRHPDTVFHLYGEGEENTDIWIKDFWNGNMQVRVTEIKFSEFDPTFGGKRNG